MKTFSKNQQYPNPWSGGIYTIKSDGTELKIIVQDEVSYKSKRIHQIRPLCHNKMVSMSVKSV